jgi:hypothetical protein
MDYQHTPAASKAMSTTTGLNCHETPWFYIAAATEAKQRTSLISRLKTVGPNSRPHSQSLSMLSLALTETSSRRSSCDWRQGPPLSPYERPENPAKSILSRGGRMLRRQGSKFNIGTFLAEEAIEEGRMEVSETCQRPQQSRKRSKGLGSTSIHPLTLSISLIRHVENLKRSISHPFDFHHVTHTQPRHFERLDRGSQNELITEFIAIRAAQRPKSTLQGIHADDLDNAGHAKQSDTEAQGHSAPVPALHSSVGDRKVSVSSRSPPTSPGCSNGIRPTPSIENFSRPAPWSPKSPTLPPPRISSRNIPDCSPLPSVAVTKITGKTDGTPVAQLPNDTQSRRDPNPTENEPQLAVTHAITTVDGSAMPLGIQTVPTPSRDVMSGSTADARTREAQCSALSTTPPLHHTSSFQTTKILAQQNHQHHPKNYQGAAETRPGSLRSQGTDQWEDVVDYCYEQAAEADCNFDWSQKTVYVDVDLESTDAPPLEGDLVGEPASSTDDQPLTPRDLEPRPRPGAFHLPRIPSMNDNQRRLTSEKSVKELEDRLSPFGRHESSSEIRGYQHWSPPSSKPNPDVDVALNDPCVDQNACLHKEACGCTDVELPPEHPSTLERCYSGESSTFRGLRPLTNKYSSDGSLLSSTTSTIRTYRSSNSVGSLPELIHSLNSSRENIMTERTSPADTVNSGSRPFPPRVAPASRTQPDLGRSIGERQRVPSLPTINSCRDTASDVAAASPRSPCKRQSIRDDHVGDLVRADVRKAKAGLISTRKRSASAVTFGQRLPTRGSYSLFPTQQSLNRRA